MTSKINQMRHGAYGIVMQDSRLLLTKKKAGAFRGLWGLPGGGIEFGETPEDTVKRELLEESCLVIDQLEFFGIATSTGEYEHNGVPYGLHQVGLIYKVPSWTQRSDLIPEEENRWVMLKDIKLEELTPFATYAVSKLA